MELNKRIIFINQFSAFKRLQHRGWNQLKVGLICQAASGRQLELSGEWSEHPQIMKGWSQTVGGIANRKRCLETAFPPVVRCSKTLGQDSGKEVSSVTQSRNWESAQEPRRLESGLPSPNRPVSKAGGTAEKVVQSARSLAQMWSF